ncbi:hypothetical protein AWT69_001548 [Pseudomonas putida]|nr:hypothetical protein AWT69_001548 [Pseudomonas putida]
MLVGGRRLAGAIADHEHYSSPAWGIGRELFLKNPDLIGFLAVGPGR